MGEDLHLLPYDYKSEVLVVKQVGVVVGVQGEKAVVQIKRVSACGENCSSCSGGCQNTSHKVEALNMIAAKQGQVVQMEMKDSDVLIAAFMVYIIPLILLFTGYFVGSSLFKVEWLAITVGIMFMISSFMVLKKYDNKLRKSKRYTPIINKIMG